MGQATKISWCDHTFNIVWGCQKVSPGCANCYAETLSNRFGHGYLWGPNSDRQTMSECYWQSPSRWNRLAEKKDGHRKVFCGSMCDVFEDHPVVKHELAKLWQLTRQTPNLIYQLLTKRADRIMPSLPWDWVIYGGESGPGFRKDSDNWTKYMRQACAAEGVAYWHKQHAGPKPGHRDHIDGCTVQEFPTPRVLS